MQNSPFEMLFQVLNNGGDPRQIMSDLLKSNPQVETTLKQLKNMSQGQSPKDFAMQLAKQKGVDPKQVEMIAQKMGLK